MNHQNIIYGLIDPTTRLIFYVGLSSKGLRRPKEHRVSGSSRCREWVRKLQQDGLDYEIVTLEHRDSPVHLPEAERWWIAYGRGCGWPLTNQTEGGELYIAVPPALTEEDKQRERLAAERFEQSRQARRLYMCLIEYDMCGAESALEMAYRYLATDYFEWLEVAIIDHYQTICKDLPSRLACPCGHSAPFSDEASLLTAVFDMNCHFLRNSCATKKGCS